MSHEAGLNTLCRNLGVDTALMIVNEYKSACKVRSNEELQLTAEHDMLIRHCDWVVENYATAMAILKKRDHVKHDEKEKRGCLELLEVLTQSR